MQNTSEKPSSRAWVVCRKEFREIFRDKRTVMSVIIGPLIITPVLFAVIGLGVTKQVEKVKSETYPVGVIGGGSNSTLLAELKKMPNLRFEPVASAAEAEKQIKSRTLNAAIVLPADADAMVTANQAVKVEILSDAGEEMSQAASRFVQAALAQVGDRYVAARLKATNLPPGFAKPFEVAEKSIASGGGRAMLVLSSMLPYLLILAAFSGAIYAAFDQVAGEKERGTLETLLVSPASRRDLVFGKFAAVVGVCLISSILSIVGLAIPFVSGLKVFAWLSQGGISLGPTAMGVVLIVLLPISVLFAGMLLAVSTFSRNQKEAQTYLGSLFPIVLVPALFSTFMGANVSPGIALVPILNATIIIKQALNGSYNGLFITLAFAASVVYAALALAIATSMFQKESVLIKA